MQTYLPISKNIVFFPFAIFFVDFVNLCDTLFVLSDKLTTDSEIFTQFIHGIYSVFIPSEREHTFYMCSIYCMICCPV